MPSPPRVPATRCSIVLLVSQLGVGGAERHMVTLAHRLADRFGVVLVYIKRDERLLDQLQTERLKEVHCLDVRRGLELQAARRLAALLDRHGADVVLCANSYPMLYAQLARAHARRRVRVIEVYHTTLIPSLRGRLMMALLYTPLARFASALVFVCDAQMRYWTRRGFAAKRVSRIYNGVDTAYFDPARFVASIQPTRERYGFASTDRVIGICAVLRPEKAHADLLRAVACARDEGCDWKVLIIGDGPMRASVERQIEELNLSGGVRVTGYLKDVRREIAACDAIALVSTAVETFSIAALEAMAMGKPIIMSDIGGAREQVVPGENGWLFPAGDIPALTARLKAAADRSALSTMGSAARERTGRLFSLDAMVESYTELIASMCTGVETVVAV